MGAGKVLIVQNQIGFDGRSRISIELVAMLNEVGITPDVLTCSRKRYVEHYTNGLYQGLACNVIRLRYPFSTGHIPQALVLNVLAARKAGSYDCVFNLNDNFYCLGDRARYIHVIADPLEHTFALARDLRVSDIRKYYALVFAALCKGLKARTRGLVIAISQFTKKRLIEVYPNLADRIIIVNPPCLGENDMSAGAATKAYDVVSVGTFTPTKGQLEQLELARRWRDMTFAVIGSVYDYRYFRECVRYRASEGLRNVALLPSLSRAAMLAVLERSRIFLHWKPNEGFGITTVEAIGRGCIPVVPDSGGQIEVVPLAELRFRADEDLGEKIRYVRDLDKQTVVRWRGCLQSHVKSFSVEAFRAKMKEVIASI